MKTFTSLLSVNRLLTSLLSIAVILVAGNAFALTSSETYIYKNGEKPNFSTSIEYASLAASANEKAVFINWVTAWEQNNSHFEVERSTNMKDFTTVAMVLDGFAAAGTGKSYKFKEDAGAVRNGKTVYYRLKQVDTDNKVHYSKIMAVQMNSSVTVVPVMEIKQANSTNTNTTRTKLLSKQSTQSTGVNNISVAGLSKPTAGIFAPRIFMAETELNFPKLVFA